MSVCEYLTLKAMSEIENEIKTALDGKRSDVSGKFNDFTLAQQNQKIGL